MDHKYWERPHHQRIQKLLAAFDGEFLLANGCYFGGGTAIVLALGEYRESLDVDFVCASREGYRAVRNTVQPASLGRLLKAPVELLRDVRTDQYGVRTFARVDGVSIKIELISENRIEVEGGISRALGVPVLSKADMQAEKLLANADRGLDRAFHSRDIIDLAMTIPAWGHPTKDVWDKVKGAYGENVVERFDQARQMVCDDVYLNSCLTAMWMDLALGPKIQDTLGCRREPKAAPAAAPESPSLEF